MRPVSFAAAVLTGGRSRRFGRDKARARFLDATLLQRVVASLRDAEALALVGDRRYPEATRGSSLTATELRDRLPDGGPLAGLEAALRWSPTPWLALAACDLPRLVPAYWQLLAECAEGAPAVAVVHPDGRSEPLAALYHVRCLPEASERLTRGERSMQALLAALGARPVPLAQAQAVAGARVLANVNRPADLRRAARPPDGCG